MSFDSPIEDEKHQPLSLIKLSQTVFEGWLYRATIEVPYEFTEHVDLKSAEQHTSYLLYLRPWGDNGPRVDTLQQFLKQHYFLGCKVQTGLEYVHMDQKLKFFNWYELEAFGPQLTEQAIQLKQEGMAKLIVPHLVKTMIDKFCTSETFQLCGSNEAEIVETDNSVSVSKSYSTINIVEEPANI